MSGGNPPGILGLNYTPAIDLQTLHRSLTPTPSLICEEQNFIDEMTPIASYMSLEMNMNIKSSAFTKMKSLNSYSSTDCINEYQELSIWRQLFGLGITPDQCVNRSITYHVAALAIWAGKVAQGAAWDHKPIISRNFHPRNPKGNQHWHLYKHTLYYYDVWSNVHYGYVGIAAGFSESALLDGAGLEQVASSLARGKLPKKNPNIKGLRAWDDSQDMAGIKIGIQLYRLHPFAVSTQVLLNSILMSPDIRSKRYQG